MTSFSQTDTVATCAFGTYCAAGTANTTTSTRQAQSGAAAGINAVSLSINGNASDKRALMFELIVPTAANWTAGTWTVKLNVTTGNTNLTLQSVFICRVSSGCVSQATVGSSSALGLAMGVGVKTVTVSGSSQAASVGDKIVVVFGVSNSKSTTQSFSYTPNQLILSPFTVTENLSAGISVADYHAKNITKALVEQMDGLYEGIRKVIARVVGCEPSS